MNERDAGPITGIMSYVYGNSSAEEMAAAINGHDIAFAQVDPRQKGLLDGDGRMGIRQAEHIRKVFQQQGISIPVLSGYMNLLDPDPGRREANLQEMEEMIELCPSFGAGCIATETGSLHPTNPWGYHPDNDTEAAWDALLHVTERLRLRAASNGVTLLLEGYVNNVLSTAERAARLIRELPSAGLGLVMDPFNYIKEADLKRQEEALDVIFNAIAPHCVIAHAKDTLYTAKGIHTPRAGTGLMQWKLVADRLTSTMPDAVLYLEHLQPDEVEECLAFIRQAYRQ
jgi:sugar phosphate isomerase/epimerase